jgi:nitrite reductase/ring-hydroxylating ferredoxin subunit
MEEFAMADNGQNVIRVCAQADVPPGTVKAFAVGSNTLAVYNIDGAYYITDDECTHAAASLADGMLEGVVIECCMHMGSFHVPTGNNVVAHLRGGVAHILKWCSRATTFSSILPTTPPESRNEGGAVARRADQLLRMRNVVAPASLCFASRMSPVWASRVGMSMAASGSVQATTKMSPACIPASALRVRNTGSGHFRPRKSNVFSVI